jgi:hypothetical protein
VRAIFFAFRPRFSWTPCCGMGNHHGQEEEFLILPCDWRFLPKLGPLRSFSLARGPFSSINLALNLVTCLGAQVLTHQTFFFQKSLVRRTIIFGVEVCRSSIYCARLT